MKDLEALIADLTSGDDQIAESALPHLAQLGEVALNAILKLLNSCDPDHRWWAVRSLSDFKNPSAGEGLHQALSDPEPSVRQCAALSLRLSPFAPAIPSLIKALESDDRLFARLAGDALVQLGEEAIAALGDTLHSSVPVARGEAARALAKMGLPDVIPILYAAANDPSSIVQYWVEDGFERLGVGMVYFKP